MRSTFTKPIFTGLVSLVVFNVANPSWAVSVESVLNSRQLNGSRVSDQANLLSPETEAELNRLISQLERKNGNEIAVVTVIDTAPSASPKQFATTLFNRWGIGKRGANNGVLFLISKGDRRVEIETGYGLQTILSDAKVSNIIREQITPRFKQQDFNGGVLVGTKALIRELNPARSLTTVSVPVVTHTVQNESGGNDWLMGVGAAALLISGTVGVIKFVRPRKLIAPEGRTRIFGAPKSDRSPYHCAKCKHQMKKLDDAAIFSILREPKRVAQQLGSVKFEGWQCSHCLPLLGYQALHLRTYVIPSPRYKICHHCQEITLEYSDRILQAATQHCTGTELITEHCHCCGYRAEEEIIIPCLPPPTSSSSYSNDSSSSYSSDSSSTSSSNDSSSSSDFGGGSSGGGGAGGDW